MKEKISTLFKKPRNVIIIATLIVVVGSFFIISALLKDQSDQLEEGQIRLEKGGRVVTVNQNGLVEYRSEDGVFYETWTPDRTSAFFRNMEEEARRYLKNEPDSIPENAYKVTLWLDGEVVVIYITEDSEIIDSIDEIFEEFEDTPDGDVSDYFDDNDNVSPTAEPTSATGNGVQTLSLTPTSAQFPTTPTPSFTGGGNNDGYGEQSAQDCDLYNTQVTKRTVISNTICLTE